MADFMQDILPLLSPVMGVLGGPGGSIHPERLFTPALVGSLLQGQQQGQQGQQFGNTHGLASLLLQQGSGSPSQGGMFGIGRFLGGGQ